MEHSNCSKEHLIQYDRLLLPSPCWDCQMEQRVHSVSIPQSEIKSSQLQNLPTPEKEDATVSLSLMG